jgi:hypothetical protein
MHEDPEVPEVPPGTTEALLAISKLSLICCDTSCRPYWDLLVLFDPFPPLKTVGYYLPSLTGLRGQVCGSTYVDSHYSVQKNQPQSRRTEVSSPQ